MVLLALLAGCVATTPVDTGSLHHTGVVELDVLPTARVDLLVIGSGAAGLTAAWVAAEGGASVLVLERDEVAGGAARFARGLYAVGSQPQLDAGSTDDVATALEEWSEDAPGGDGTDPTVAAFVAGSAAIIDFIVEELDRTVMDATRPRSVVLYGDADAPTVVLAERLAAHIALEHQAEGLVFDGDRAVGASYTDLSTGETGWVQASHTLVATGGFARHLAQVQLDRAELAGWTMAADHAPSADGGGLPLLEGVGSWQNTGGLGIYLHGIPDPRDGYEGELLVLGELDRVPFVDESATRFVDETTFRELSLPAGLADTTPQQLWALYPDAVAKDERARIPGYHDPDAPPGELDFEALAELGTDALAAYDTVEELALALGLDADVLADTLDDWDDAVLGGTDTWRDDPPEDGFEDRRLWAAELTLSTSKAFSGFATDEQGRLLTASGEVIEGLYAAGEVAGMLGTPAVGTGWEGSITACYWMGWTVGEQVVAER